MDMNIGLAMINGLGQMALVAISFGMVKRLDMRPWQRSCLLGLVFGGGAVLAMATPAAVAPGIFIDTRAIMVGLAGAFAGVPASLITATAAALYRVWLGGAGMPMGVVAIVIAMLVGILWQRFWPADRRDSARGLALLGSGIAAHSLVVLLLPVALPDGFHLVYFPSIIAACLIATMSLGWMMQREIKLILRERSLAGYAFTDPLTGLANRRAFDRRMTASDVCMDAPEFGVVLLDIDHFKSINDRFGHDVGDAVLRRLATTVAATVRERDLVARHGGEEFVILLPGTGLEESREIAERIRERIAAEPIDLLDRPLDLTASFGVATSRYQPDHRSMLMAADVALYKAKEYGRNRVETAVLAAAPAAVAASDRPAQPGLAQRGSPSAVPAR